MEAGGKALRGASSIRIAAALGCAAPCPVELPPCTATRRFARPCKGAEEGGELCGDTWGSVGSRSEP